LTESFTIFGLTIRYYGVLIITGALAGAFLAARAARRKHYDPEIVWDLFVYLMVGGVIGARVWHILTPSPSAGVTTSWYLSHPIDMIAIWQRGGLGIPGAIIAGVIVLYFYSRRIGINFSEWVDIIAPSLALGQAIGRWGNLFNQELYGPPTTLPWKIFIDEYHRIPGFSDSSYFHPLFLYESIWNLINMTVLLWISHRFADRLRDGDIFLTYLIVYPAGRFFLDYLRVDVSLVGGININQTLMALVAGGASITLYLRHRKV